MNRPNLSCRHTARWACKFWLIAFLLLSSMLILAPGVGADTVSWRGEYYNNITLSGSPVLVRDDAAINFDWGAGVPAPGVPADRFSVRWTSFVYFAAGNYTFHVTADDGARLWVDDQLIIDQWRDQGATTYNAAKYLSAGYHSVRMEYYENGGNAVARLWWDTGGATITEWRGEYYNNANLTAPVAVVRNDSAVNFDWGYGSPAPGVNAEYFSARWTRDVSFATSGNYVFSATVDDGVRVWVDSVLVIDRWYPQARTTHSGSIYLNAGTHQVRVEYFEATGLAVCKVSWAVGGSSGATEVIVDDRDGGFIWGGPTSAFYGRSAGYRGHLFWTWNGSTQAYNWGKWFPHLPSAGNWEVYVYIANQNFGSKSARYTIYHSGTSHTQVVNQNNYSNQWVSLGTYAFTGGSSEYVYLSDATGEAYATRFVGFDAVKFVKRDGAPQPPPPPPSGCAITPVLGFGRIWNSYSAVRTKLGCPTANEKSVWAAEQAFQGGYMYWREDLQDIYVLYNNGTWQSYDDTWTSAEPEWDTNIVPPAGYYQPKRGFGKVWRNNVGVRNGLAWATTEERGFNASLQQFEGGVMLWSNLRGVFVLYNDGRWERYN